jgi:hypothetical protein
LFFLNSFGDFEILNQKDKFCVNWVLRVVECDQLDIGFADWNNVILDLFRFLTHQIADIL